MRKHVRARTPVHRLTFKLLRLARQPEFWAITLIGNSIAAAGAFGLYWLEHGLNPKLTNGLDALWWAMQTVTSVGYGDVIPVTPAGRILGMGLMIVGTAIFCSYTALFAGALLGPELALEVEREIQEGELPLQEELRALELQMAGIQETLKRLRDK